MPADDDPQQLGVLDLGVDMPIGIEQHQQQGCQQGSLAPVPQRQPEQGSHQDGQRQADQHQAQGGIEAGFALVPGVQADDRVDPEQQGMEGEMKDPFQL